MASSELGRHGPVSRGAERHGGVHWFGLPAALRDSFDESRGSPEWGRWAVLRRAVPEIAGGTVGALLRRRDHDRGLARFPLVTEAEGQGRGVAGIRVLGEIELAMFQETIDRADV